MAKSFRDTLTNEELEAARGVLDNLPTDEVDISPEMMAATQNHMMPFERVVIDPYLLDQEKDYVKEEKVRLTTEYADLRAHVVFRDDELAFVELSYPTGSKRGAPAPTPCIVDVLNRAHELGYPLSLLLRRITTDERRGFHVEHHIVIFEPEPELDEGVGVTITIRLGIDVDDEDYGPRKKAVQLRDEWLERIEKLVKQTYPRARLELEIVEDEAEDVTVSAPSGLDPTDFEWRVEDLIERASSEILELESRGLLGTDR